MFETTGAWDQKERRQVLPDAIRTMPPGPELGNLLARVDRSLLNGHEMVLLLSARARQISHLQAEFYADVWELALCPGGDIDSDAERLTHIDDLVAHELRAALMLTQRSAENHLNVAWALNRLPQVRDALHGGVIDLPRARVLCEETSHLDQGEAAQVVDSLLDLAPELTTGQLGARIRRRCIEVDPEAARRRYEEGVAGRHVEGRQNPDGTADLLGRDPGRSGGGHPRSHQRHRPHPAGPR